MARSWHKRDYGSMHEINVANLVDVVLVILIVFMISAPLMQSGIDVNLPETKFADATLSDGVVVTIDERSVIYVDDVTANEGFEEIVRRAYDVSESKKVFLRADRGVTHGRVVEVMGMIKSAGIPEVGLVTKLPESSQQAKTRIENESDN
jgi:biopolymer transport protein TolR